MPGQRAIPTLYVDDNMMLSGQFERLFRQLVESGHDFDIDYSTSPILQAPTRPRLRSDDVTAHADSRWRFDPQRFAVEVGCTGFASLVGGHMNSNLGWWIGIGVGYTFSRFAWSRRTSD